MSQDLNLARQSRHNNVRRAEAAKHLGPKFFCVLVRHRDTDSKSAHMEGVRHTDNGWVSEFYFDLRISKKAVVCSRGHLSIKSHQGYASLQGTGRERALKPNGGMRSPPRVSMEGHQSLLLDL